MPFKTPPLENKIDTIHIELPPVIALHSVEK